MKIIRQIMPLPKDFLPPAIDPSAGDGSLAGPEETVIVGLALVEYDGSRVTEIEYVAITPSTGLIRVTTAYYDNFTD